MGYKQCKRLIFKQLIHTVILTDIHIDIRLEVDGGVTPANIREIAEAGADMFVAGSAIFGKPDYKAVIDEMRRELALVGSVKA